MNSQYAQKNMPLWDACEQAFSKMFKVVDQDIDRIGPHVYSVISKGSITNPEVVWDNITNREDWVKTDWSWYCDERYGYALQRSNAFELYYHDNELYKWLIQSEKYDNKHILVIHGRTGVGKTTFIRHFFFKVLKDQYPHIAKDIVFIRISMPVVSPDLNRAEDDYDHSVYFALLKLFHQKNNPKYDLMNPETLIEMACSDELLEEEDIPKVRNTLKSTYPPPEARSLQLRWIREIAEGRRANKTNIEDDDQNILVSDYADFNRLALRYLCRINSNLKFVIFMDNVDHLPALNQQQAFLLSRHKLGWIKKFKQVYFIIALRSYMLKNSWKEDTFSAYSNKVEKLEIFPPSLYQVLDKRREFLFAPESKKRTAVLKHIDSNRNAINIPIPKPEEMVKSIVNAFEDRKRDTYIAKLTNYDIRQGLEIAKSVIQFPFYPWDVLADSIEKHYSQNPSGYHSLLSFDRIIDAIVRKTNRLCEVTLPFFDNVFRVDDSDHFANSLCKLYILKFLSKRTFSLKELMAQLMFLGHPEPLINIALESLLKCNIITSPEGIHIEEHNIKTIHSEGTSLCDEYLCILSKKLYYLQGMAYCTPMEYDLCCKIPLPSEIHNDDRTFESRVLAASLLLEQFKRDSESQRNYINGLERRKGKIANLYWEQAKLGDLVEVIRLGLLSDLKNIQDAGGFKALNWANLRKLFGD